MIRFVVFTTDAGTEMLVNTSHVKEVWPAPTKTVDDDTIARSRLVITGTADCDRHLYVRGSIFEVRRELED